MKQSKKRNLSAHLRLSRLALLATTLLAGTAVFAENGEVPPLPGLGPGPGPAPGAPPARGGAALNILQIGDRDIASLRTLGTGRKPDAISLGISRARLQADAAAWQALAGWVRDGGVVFLHTDSAELFGYRTVPARVGTPQLAGLLYGRARSALPFGGHPLLWSGTTRSTGLPSLSASSRLLPELGVQIVYYQLDPGDALVVEHPAATPLLRVTDLAAYNTETLYAAAIAPFGNGWAVFTPRLIEQDRADGASFAQNLLRLVRSVGPSPFDAPPLNTTATAAPPPAPATPTIEPLVGIPGTIIEKLSDADGGWPAQYAAWQKDMQRIPSAMMAPAEVTKPDVTARLLVAKSEADALGAGLAAAAQTGNDKGLRLLLALLRARLEYQRLDYEQANEWMQTAAQLGPNTAEVLLWRGAFVAAGAQNLLLSSQDRSQRYQQAVTDWTASQTATPLIKSTAPRGAASVSGVPTDAIQNWTAAATRAAQLMAVEPPMVLPVQNLGGGLVIRHFANDPTLRTAIPGAAFLARSDAFLGWHLDEEEILIFPNDQYYSAYSTAARVANSEVAYNPLARRGNVLGNRILMVSQITQPVLLDPGPPPRFAQLGAAVPAVLARLHSQVLLNALTQDGTRPPGWMQLGMMSIANVLVTTDPRNDPTAFMNNTQRQDWYNQPIPKILRDTAMAGGLLTPRQFDNVNPGADQAGIAEAQARRMMAFFYVRFGSGAVIETLQRLGSGQAVEDALVETTGLTEDQFFLAWRNSEFGRG